MELIMDPIFGIVYAPFVVMLVALSEFIRTRLATASPNLEKYTWFPFGVTLLSGILLTLGYRYGTVAGADPEFMRNIFFTFAVSVLTYDGIVGPTKKAIKRNREENE